MADAAPQYNPASMSAKKQTASGLSWKLRSDDEALKLAISQHYDVSPLLASILAGRNVALHDVPDILSADLKTSLPDPSHLKDMDGAVSRIVQAIQSREVIALFGDYDVDGATATASFANYLRALNVPYLTYIPDRVQEGYGPNVSAFDTLIDEGARLIITMDCGTLAYEPIAHAKARGADVIVLDHHTAESRLPEALAVVNPNRVDETSPHTNLCAAGVVFLVLVALNRALRESGFFTQETPEPNLLTFLDLTALGTVCDVMTLTGLNRVFVKQGLKVLAHRRRIGLNALADIAGLDTVPDTYHLGFLLGPRINAGGRVGQADLGVQLLTTTDEIEAKNIAQQLHQHNAERQALEQQVLQAALSQAETQTNSPVILVHDDHWHEGVIGIVAARLKETHNRPAIVITGAGEQVKGSGRSVEGADLGVAVHHAEHAGLIEYGGGHAMAAGFTLQRSNIHELQQFFCERLEQAVTHYQDNRVKKFDAWIDVAGITAELLEDMASITPYGNGFAAPKLAIKSAKITYQKWLKDKHLKLRFAGETGASAEAIAFNVAGTTLGQMLSTHSVLHLYGEVKANHWQGRTTPQLIISDAMLPDN